MTETKTAAGAQSRAWMHTAGPLFGALLAIVASEAALRRVSPLPPPIREVDDGVADLIPSNPDIIVLGSSHARSFDAVAQLLAERSSGAVRMITVPEEGGSFLAFDWVLQNRLRRLIEEQDASGRPVRSRLSHFFLVTTYWDMCPVDPEVAGSNLPARGWTWRNYFADVGRNGVTPFNRNFLQSRWKAFWEASYLIRDRGGDHLRRGVLQALHLERRPTVDERRESRLATRRPEFEDDYARCDDPEEKAAFERILDYLESRQLDTTVVVFPLVQEALSEKAKNTTLFRYSEYVGELSKTRSFRVADMTTSAPLSITDFEPDLDHVTPAGNRKFAAWALDNGLSFLLRSNTSTAATTSPRTRTGS
jgi:hypothetical protein